MVENSLSSLLKNNSDRIAAFGFPIISREPEQTEPVESSPVEPAYVEPPEEKPADPVVTAEETYRRKLLELERRTQEIERDAYSKGFAQGEKDGVDYGQKSVQVVSSQIERIAQNMKALPAKVLEDYREWLIRTSIAIARQIVNREIRTAPEIVADLARDLIEEAEQHSTLTVSFNPSDLEIIEKKSGLTPQDDGKLFILKADRELERGGCRVESQIQLIDASVAAVFENLEKELLAPKALPERRPAAQEDGEES